MLQKKCEKLRRKLALDAFVIVFTLGASAPYFCIKKRKTRSHAPGGARDYTPWPIPRRGYVPEDIIITCDSPPVPLPCNKDLDLQVLRPEECVAVPGSGVTGAPVPAVPGSGGKTRQHRPSDAMSQISGIRRSLHHTNSLTTLPKYGVETPREQELGFALQDLDRWGCNIFKVAEYSGGKPLTAVTYTIFKDREFSSKMFLTFLMTPEYHYLKVPYHNSNHAADVTLSIHVLLLSPALETVLTDLEILAALFADAIHDVDHPVVTNQYTSSTQVSLALAVSNTVSTSDDVFSVSSTACICISLL
ncbi:hypothetical protein V5799_004408 [Amblyomma americanum]|uniref:PDEase domain-containing protein n=1 Tax=Amblyomma americanum TaxID=6943 RepID=A0AAQ4D684_AMBAM